MEPRIDFIRGSGSFGRPVGSAEAELRLGTSLQHAGATKRKIPPAKVPHRRSHPEERCHDHPVASAQKVEQCLVELLGVGGVDAVGTTLDQL